MKIFDDILDELWTHFNNYKDEDWVTKNSIPILFFGNINKYIESQTKIITVAKNPSHNEFPDKIKRFETDINLLKNNEKYLNTLSQYFKQNPLTEWFNSFEKLLQYLNASYYEDNYPSNSGNTFDWKPKENIVLHTDICSPLSTNPTWSLLLKKNPNLKSELSKIGTLLWHKLIQILKPDIILLSAASYTREMVSKDLTWENLILPNEFKKKHELKLSNFKQSKLFWISPLIKPISFKDEDKAILAEIIKKHS